MERLLASFTLVIIIASSASAAVKTITLSVPGMTCAACPITVKKALGKVEGVTKTEVSFEIAKPLLLLTTPRQAPKRSTRQLRMPAIHPHCENDRHV